MTELIKDYKVQGFNVTICRITTIWRSWYTVYIGKDKFLKKLFEDDLEGRVFCHGGITWNDIYPFKAPKSKLTGKEVIGWDYCHTGDESTTEEMVLSDVEDTVSDIVALERCGDLAW